MLEGELRIDLEQGHLWLRRGELLVMPRGRRYRPFALQARVLLRELRRTAGRRRLGDPPAGPARPHG